MRGRLLQDIVYANDFDILSFHSKTWSNYSIDDQEIFPTGYNIYRHDRIDRDCGGTLTAIKSYLYSSEIVKSSEFSCLEVTLVEIINLKNYRSVLIENAYRPRDSADFVPKFSDLLKSLLLNRYSSVVVMGDFSFPNIQWVDRTGFASSSTGEDSKFANLMMGLLSVSAG